MLARTPEDATAAVPAVRKRRRDAVCVIDWGADLFDGLQIMERCRVDHRLHVVRAPRRSKRLNRRDAFRRLSRCRFTRSILVIDPDKLIAREPWYVGARGN